MQYDNTNTVVVIVIGLVIIIITIICSSLFNMSCMYS